MGRCSGHFPPCPPHPVLLMYHAELRDLSSDVSGDVYFLGQENLLHGLFYKGKVYLKFKKWMERGLQGNKGRVEEEMRGRKGKRERRGV